MEKSEIEKILPHRGRALLLDKAEINKEQGSAIGYLTVTAELCEGHFPGNPIMRGVDRIEMIALTLGLAACAELPGGFLPYLVSFDKVRFPGIVVAGDEIRAEAILNKISSRIIRGKGKAFVQDKLVAEVDNIVCVMGKAKDI